MLIEFLTEGDDAVVEATHFTWFWNNEALTNKLKTAFPDATVHTRRLPPMWTLQNPLVESPNSIFTRTGN